MASAQKTDFLSLNKWISTDIPKREDFNYDNTTIDTAFKEHLNDMSKHISETERSKWNTSHYIGFYTGDGAVTRTISTACPFDPAFGIVFAGAVSPALTDFKSPMHRTRFGFISKRASNSGLAFSGKNIAVSSPSDTTYHEAAEYNRVGGTYCYILFR